MSFGHSKIMVKPDESTKIRWIWLSIFVAVSGLTLVGLYAFHSYEFEQIGFQRFSALQSDSQSKTERIYQWREQRLGDASRIVSDHSFQENMNKLFREPGNTELKAVLGSWVENSSKSNDFNYIVILDTKGNRLISYEPQPVTLSTTEKLAIEKAVMDGLPVLTDLYRSSLGGVQLGIVVPVKDHSGHPHAVVVFGENASSHLDVLTGFYTKHSKTAETYLVRKDGDYVLFLTDLRFKNDAGLNFRLPLTIPDLPAAQAVMGKTGKYIGKDYRGIPVFADLRPIPDSPWIMVAEIDVAEIAAEAKHQTLYVGFFAAMLLLGTGLSGIYAFQKGRTKLYENLYRSELELREAGDLFRTTLYSLADGVIVTDIHGVVKQMNHVSEKLTGWSEAEAKGKLAGEVCQLINEESRESIRNPVDTVLAENTVMRMDNQTVLVSRHGTECPISNNAAPIRNESGSVIGAVLILRDQTGERVAQKALQDSENRYRQLSENSPTGIFIEQDGVSAYVNQRMSDMLGYTVNELIGQRFTDVLHPDDRERVSQNVKDFYLGEAPLAPTRFRLLKKTGETIWCDCLSSTINYQGRPGIMGNLADITERHKVEEALRASEEKFRLIAESVSESIWLLDENYRVEYVSPYDETMRGFKPEEIMGRPIFDMLNPDYASSLRDAAVQRQANEESHEKTGVRIYEAEVVCKDGRSLLTEGKFTPIRDEKGLLTGFVGIIRDISDRKRAEEAAIQSARLKSVADLSGGVAHHFNNLLQMVTGSSELALDSLESGENPEAKIWLENLKSSVSKGATMVERLLTFALPRNNVSKREGPIFDASSTAKNAAEFLESSWMADAEQIDLGIELQMLLEDGCMMHGEEKEIFEVVLNLLKNSAEALPQGGIIELRTFKEDDKVVIIVRDSGIGIPEDEIPHVFEPFWTTKGFAIGKGMGLAVVHGLVKRNAGDIYVQSKVGEGTTFRVMLPLAH